MEAEVLYYIHDETRVYRTVVNFTQFTGNHWPQHNQLLTQTQTAYQELEQLVLRTVKKAIQ